MTDDAEKLEADAPAPALVYLFPGVEGGPTLMKPAVKALVDGGVTAEVRVHNWKRLFGVIANLVSHADNLRMAARVADEIRQYRSLNPDATIDLLGYSGGGGLAIMVAEALPEEIGIRNIVLCQPALSPDYDLTAALRRVKGRIIHFYSPLDVAILGVGTKVFGTMDRKFVASAGMNGFDESKAVSDPDLRDKLIQCRWSGKEFRSGHWGGHLAILTYRWNKARVAPCLLADLPGDFDPCAQAK